MYELSGLVTDLTGAGTGKTLLWITYAASSIMVPRIHQVHVSFRHRYADIVNEQLGVSFYHDSTNYADANGEPTGGTALVASKRGGKLIPDATCTGGYGATGNEPTTKTVISRYAMGIVGNGWIFKPSDGYFLKSGGSARELYGVNFSSPVDLSGDDIEAFISIVFSEVGS